jgi:cytochrome c biogenesis protein CcmG/thiol:disulfide interchange protein DsbE
MWRYLLPGVIFVALIGFFFVGLHRDKSELPSPLIGKPAPQFELSLVEDPDKTISTASLKGKPFVFNVWATWCVACRQEHAALLQIAQRGEVPLIGLDWNDDRAKAQRWLRQLGNPYAATAFDGDGRVAIDWGVYGAPETFLVDANGIVVYKYIGPLTIDSWEEQFVSRLQAMESKR